MVYLGDHLDPTNERRSGTSVDNFFLLYHNERQSQLANTCLPSQNLKHV